MESTKGITRTFIVSFDHTTGDKPVLIVGEKQNNIISIISAYQDQEAINIYNKLVKENVSGN